MLKKILACALMSASMISIAAPTSTRHGMLLSITQTVLQDGTVYKQASIVSPKVQGGGTSMTITTNIFGAKPLPETSVNTFFPTIPRVDYDAFWNQLQALQNCENSLNNNIQSSYSSSGYDDAFWYWYGGEPASTKTMANDLMNQGVYPASGYTSDLSMCPINIGAYSLGVATRNNVNDYSQDSEEAIEFVTSYWVKNQGKSDAFRQNVMDYLAANKIEYAWVDVEFDIKMLNTNTIKRAAMSFQIARGDTLATKGQYIGTRLVAAPAATTATITESIIDNIIDIKYSAFSQYPDLSLLSDSAAAKANWNLMTATKPPGVNNDGVLSWAITKQTGTIIPAICSQTATCSVATGAGEIRLTSGKYDPKLQKDLKYTTDNTIAKPDALSDHSGARCFILGEGTNCSLDHYNAATLMRLSSSNKGTLTYTGRWELQFNDADPQEMGPVLKVQDTDRRVGFDVCQGLDFQNTIKVTYKVRRPQMTYKLSYDGTTVSYTIGSTRWITENLEMPSPTTYTTVSGYSYLIGSVRDNASPARLTADANSYSIINAGASDAGVGFGFPIGEGAHIVNPLVPRTTGALLLYRAIPSQGVQDRDTWSSRLTGARASSQIFYSAALPDAFKSASAAIKRNAEFDCTDMNEATYKNALGGTQYPTPTLGTPGSPPPNATPAWLPGGIVPGTISVYKTSNPGNRGVNNDDTCVIRYLLWSNATGLTISHTTVVSNTLNSAWVQPAGCTASPVPTVTGAACTRPYLPQDSAQYDIPATGSYSVDGLVNKACWEYCPIGGAVKLCGRPYPRFN